MDRLRQDDFCLIEGLQQAREGAELPDSEVRHHSPSMQDQGQSNCHAIVGQEENNESWGRGDSR